MPRCISCSSFDPYYKGGWCDYHGSVTSPDDSCNKSDWGGSHNEDGSGKTCSNCRSYSNGWCEHYRCETNSDSYCSRYT